MMTEIILKMTHPLQTRLADGLGKMVPYVKLATIRPKRLVPPLFDFTHRKLSVLLSYLILTQFVKAYLGSQ
jgi:hypothetical protein